MRSRAARGERFEPAQDPHVGPYAADSLLKRIIEHPRPRRPRQKPGARP